MRLLFFPDLCEQKLVANWTTLNRWIAERDFPQGHMLGRRRAWTEREVLAWVESQPTENPSPLKGAAKRVAAAREVA